MAKLKLTIALDRYDRHVPLFDGSVKAPDGVELQFLAVGQGSAKADGADRNRRMLQGGEFDVAEYGLSPYVIAKSRTPDLPVVAIPVFPRRLFSQNRMYVRADGDIRKPKDLMDRRVGLNSTQNTLAVLAKGDLASDYGIGWRDVDYVALGAEHFPLDPGEESVVETVPQRADGGEMLLRGDLDGLFLPHHPASLMACPELVRPLFPDPKAEILRYHRKRGFFPIMHLVVVRRELLEREPWLAASLCRMFDAATRMIYDDYRDPNYTILAWGHDVLEEQRRLLGDNPWPSGLAANRANLEQFISYTHDQLLIAEPIPVESLFHESVLDT